MTKYDGGCLCGAVRFEAEVEGHGAHACHCSDCRKWTGGPLIAISVPAKDLHVKNDANVHTFVSSDWAVREFCTRCGSTLWYKVTAEGPHQNTHYVALGSFDDPSDFSLESEIFIDRKPKGYSFAGERPTKTADEIFAEFGG